MSEELTLEGLELKKPLEKMTQKELRDLCINKLPMITGASGMSKEEILPAIKEVLGIEDDEDNKVNPYKDQIASTKAAIRGLRKEKAGISARRERCVMRKKINKLKKRTRRLAAYGA